MTVIPMVFTDAIVKEVRILSLVPESPWVLQSPPPLQILCCLLSILQRLTPWWQKGQEVKRVGDDADQREKTHNFLSISGPFLLVHLVSRLGRKIIF